MENAVSTSVRSRAAHRRSMSRPIRVDFVRMEKGFRAAERVSTIPRVSR